MQKTSFKTRLLALLTAVFMVVVSIPFAAFADNTATLNYYCSGDANHGGHQAAEVTISASSATSVTLQEVKDNLPKGYVLVNEKNSYDINYDSNGGYVYIDVTEAETKTITINYYSESENKKAGEVEMTVAADATSVNSSELTAPNGYELVESGDFPIRDGYVYVAVKPVPTTKTITINYYSESENKQAGEAEMTVAADATSVNSSELTAPNGYELVESGDFPIRDGYVYVAVKPVPTTKTIKINYYSEAEEKQIAEVEMTVAADATYINTRALTAPEGYELVLSGDLAIRDGYVYAAVKKIGSKVVKINYYSEAEEKQIKEEELTVAPDATCVNTSKLTAPTGYELVEVGDLPIRDGYVYAAVRKVPTTTIKISYVDEATDKEVSTEDLVVNQGTTVVNFNVLKSVPAGYELCEVGDFYVGNGSAKVMVRKTKSNNGSSSSSASSSSNTTNTSASNTTNTSASQKQVVKAAAAPANTTKVLPKTGATNAAPLIGGSLAVVALLMGYGVYGLVLRKKD